MQFPRRSWGKQHAYFRACKTKVRTKETIIGSTIEGFFLWRAQKVPSSTKHVNSEQQAEDARSQLHGWRVAAEEAVKTEKGEKQEWRVKVGQTPRRREREDCAHQQACSLRSVTVSGVFPWKERDIPKSSMKHEVRITRTWLNFTDGVT